MTNLLRFISCTIVVFFVSTSFAGNVDNVVINQFKSYLRQIHSVAIDFTQADSQGKFASGKLLISKPYKFRCNYYTPFPLIIAGNKNYVSIYDFDMEQVSRVNSEDNFFNFLLVNEENLEKYFLFESTNEDTDKLQITLLHKESERRSTITFDKISKQISEIKIFEEDNVITLNLTKLIKVSSFNNDLFILKNPDIYGPPTRFTKEEIEKEYKIAS